MKFVINVNEKTILSLTFAYLLQYNAAEITSFNTSVNKTTLTML